MLRRIVQKLKFQHFSTNSPKKRPSSPKTLIVFSIAAPVTFYGAYRFCELDSKFANKIINFYEHLPFNTLSRFDGWLAHLTIPRFLRKPIYLGYSYIFSVNLDEMENPNLVDYPSFCEFFCRRIDLSKRPVNVHATLTSPADGRILYLDRVIDGNLQQVKGIPFTVNEFLCLPSSQTIKNYSSNVDSSGEDHLVPKLSSRSHLYFCTIYLAPGDYHCFHSPTDWDITVRRYIPGRLMSVNPIVCRRVKDLFVSNERVSYLGQWRHGFFCYSAIGATNVGNISVYSDSDLTTNKKGDHSAYHDLVFQNNRSHKGEIFGDFRLGSTILLIFEAPVDFEFSVKPGDYVKVGEALSKH